MLINPKHLLKEFYTARAAQEVKSLTPATLVALKVSDRAGTSVLRAIDYRDTLKVFENDDYVILTINSEHGLTISADGIVNRFKPQPLTGKNTIWLDYSGTYANQLAYSAVVQAQKNGQEAPQATANQIPRSTIDLPLDEFKRIHPTPKTAQEAPHAVKPTVKAVKPVKPQQKRAGAHQPKPVPAPQLIAVKPTPQPAPIVIERAAGTLRYGFAPDTPAEARSNLYKLAYRMLKSDNPKAGTKRGPHICIFEYGFQISIGA